MKKKDTPAVLSAGVRFLTSCAWWTASARLRHGGILDKWLAEVHAVPRSRVFLGALLTTDSPFHMMLYSTPYYLVNNRVANFQDDGPWDAYQWEIQKLCSAERPMKTKQEDSRVASHVPGRLRVKLHSTHRHPEKMAAIQEHLESHSGVRAVRARPTSGAVVVDYDPKETSADRLLDVLHDVGVLVSGLTGEETEFGEEPFEGGNSRPANSVMSAVDDLDRRLSRVTGRKLDLKVLFPLGIGALGLRQLSRSGLGLAEVPAFMLLWYAFDAFYRLHRREAASSAPVE